MKLISRLIEELILLRKTIMNNTDQLAALVAAIAEVDATVKAYVPPAAVEIPLDFTAANAAVAQLKADALALPTTAPAA